MDTAKIQISKEQVLACENMLLGAIKAHDVKLLDQLLHDDLLFITPDGQTVTKAMDLEAHRSGAMVIEKIVPAIEKVHLIEDTAVVTLVLDNKGRMMGQPIEGKFRYIRFWKFSAGAFKVIGGSCSMIQNI